MTGDDGGLDEAAEQVGALAEEVAQLRRAVDAHALVDQAIGVVIAVGNLRPEHGWTVLKHISQHTNLKVREVADALVRWPSGEQLPEAVRSALAHALEHVRDLHREPARGVPDPRTTSAEAQPPGRCRP
ncbi:ANTAR domain-containing protein [Streptomyces sp. NPDC056716]|uniref:ANTAR domain-containing protein n=1 Tax=unclassified Streptomyces TaxID=2593676 RepID=UPI0036AD9247